MGFVDWFQNYILQQGLPPLRTSAQGGGLRKELLLGEDGESLCVVLAVCAEERGVQISLECEVAVLPFHPLRRTEFLRQRLRLNAPHETGGMGYLDVAGKELRFVSIWRERSDAGLSARAAELRFSEFLGRARRYKKIFTDLTKRQLRDAGEGELLKLERGGDDTAARILKL